MAAMKTADWVGIIVKYGLPLIIDVLRPVIKDVLGVEIPKAKEAELGDAIRIEFAKRNNVHRAEKIYAGVVRRIPPVA